MPGPLDQLRWRNRQHRTGRVSEAVPADPAMTQPAHAATPARADYEQVPRPSRQFNQHRTRPATRDKQRQRDARRRTAERVDQRCAQPLPCTVSRHPQQGRAGCMLMDEFTTDRPPHRDCDQRHFIPLGPLDRRVQRRKISQRSADPDHDPADTSRRHRATVLDQSAPSIARPPTGLGKMSVRTRHANVHFVAG
jgi:hypothetical protein